MGKSKQNKLQKRIDSFLVGYTELHKKHGLVSRIVIHFPNRKTPPVLGKLAGWLINALGGILTLRFFDARGQK